MQVNGEAIMAKEGAILALVVLLGIKGQSLLPVCVQALYNMTSAYEHFKGIERIIKALLNMSSVGFDYSDFLVKALVNCARYSWLRLRIIEDGGINSLHTLIPNIAAAENRGELVFNMITALRSLSESSGCRSEMLLKGSVELLNALLPHSDEKDKLLIIKILHNFLQSPMSLSLSAFEIATNMTAVIVNDTTFISTIQYCSACFHIITREKLRGLKQLAPIIINRMSILLRSDDAITQFFGISSAGNLFFGNLCEDDDMVELLVRFFVENGSGIIDPAAKQALALALAKLSQETKYLEVIERLQLLNKVLRLLMDLREAHRDSLLLQESCCIAICRISLRMKEDIHDDGKARIAEIFLDMLHTNDQFVLCSTISGIRALGSSGLCPKELLGDKSLLPKIASIIARFNHETELCRYGCAVLAVFSYDLSAHDILADRSILTVLFANINSEDPITRELVANTVCNLSMHAVACQTMISMNVVEVLGQLSSSTSETILDLCAKSLCNLTCFPELHKLVIQNHVLEILLMISLVRTVSSQTKCNCAKALLNLVTDENLLFITNSGAVRIFATLSTIPFAPVQSVCSKGFHVLTSNRLRRGEIVKVRPVIQSLFHMIKSAVSTMSSNVKIRLGMSVINLLACASSNTEAISAGGLSCLKIIATMEFEELREAVARLILNLALDEKFHNVLLREPVIAVLILILQKHSTRVSFAVAINGLSCLSQISVFKKILLKDLALEALIGMIISGKVSEQVICHEITRTWAHLSYVMEQAEPIIRSGRLGLALEIMHGSGLASSADTQTLMILIIRNLSESLNARIFIVEQDIFRLLVKILLNDSQRTIKLDPAMTPANEHHGIKSLGYAAMVKIIYNLSLVPPLHQLLVAQGLMELFQNICLPLQYQLHEPSQESDGFEQSYETKPQSSEYSPNDSYSSSFESHSIRSASRGNEGRSSATFIGSQSGKSPTQRVRRKYQSFANGNNSGDMDGDSSDSSKLLDFKKKSTSRLFFTTEQVDYISTSLQLLSQTHNCHESMVKGQIMAIFRSLIFSDVSEKSKREIAEALSQISQSRSCREDLVNQGACELLIALSITSDANTQAHCATALAYLSEITKVQKGVVASLLLLSLSLEDIGNLPNITNSTSSFLLSQNELLASIQPRRGGGVVDNGTINTAAVNGSNPTLTHVKTQANLNINTANTPSQPGATDVPLTALAVGNSTKNGQQTLTALLRDLMADKKRFDSYLEALQKNNQENLVQNDYVPKTPKRILTEGTAARNNRPGRSGSDMKASIPALELHLTAPHTRLAVSPYHMHLLGIEEGSLLKTNFDEYIYKPPESTEGYKPQFAGLSRKRLSDLPLPGIPPDRDLEPPNRHDELLKIPVNQDPLPKDLRAPTYLDHHKSLLLSDPNSNSMVGNEFNKSNDSNIVKDGSEDIPAAYLGSSSHESMSSPNRTKLGKSSKPQKSQDLLGKKTPLDSKSPLLQSNNLFKNNMMKKGGDKMNVRVGVRTLPKLNLRNDNDGSLSEEGEDA
jgi:hypothetical protein